MVWRKDRKQPTFIVAPKKQAVDVTYVFSSSTRLSCYFKNMFNDFASHHLCQAVKLIQGHPHWLHPVDVSDGSLQVSCENRFFLIQLSMCWRLFITLGQIPGWVHHVFNWSFRNGLIWYIKVHQAQWKNLETSLTAKSIWSSSVVKVCYYTWNSALI